MKDNVLPNLVTIWYFPVYFYVTASLNNFHCCLAGLQLLIDKCHINLSWKLLLIFDLSNLSDKDILMWLGDRFPLLMTFQLQRLLVSPALRTPILLKPLDRDATGLEPIPEKLASTIHVNINWLAFPCVSLCRKINKFLLFSVITQFWLTTNSDCLTDISHDR